jgi:hypothetical protein
MKPAASHPSYLALDRHALGLRSVETAAHLETCARCKGHLGALAQPEKIPAWARALERAPQPGLFARMRAKILIGSFALATAAAAVLVVARPTPASYEGSKGAPSVAVYVKHGEKISLWDGRAPLQAGDAIRLKVMGAGYSHLSVELLEGAKRTALYEGGVADHGETVLPNSWAFDDWAGPEHLLIVFSNSALGNAELELAAQQHPRTQQLWSTLLVFNKAGHQP